MNKVFDATQGEQKADDWWRETSFPTMDDSETDDGYVVSGELPGMKWEDIRVSVSNNLLTIHGRSKEEPTMTTSLDKLSVGAAAKVVQLQGGLGFQQQVQDLGLELGQVLRKIQHTGSGPILIEFQSQRAAVGRGIARRIIVDELSDER